MEKKPTYNVKVSIEDDILELAWTGDITELGTHETMMKEIIAIERSTNVKNKLVDIRNLKGRLGTVELYEFVRNYPSDRPRLRTAIVDNQECAQTASFHETTAINAGLPLKWFTDIDEARAWIKSK
jgi:hypothetical protein